MPMMDDEDYVPCEECGDEMSETMDQGGKVLCEFCYNKTKCGCVVCTCEQ
jgi:hypothetical protein